MSDKTPKAGDLIAIPKDRSIVTWSSRSTDVTEVGGALWIDRYYENDRTLLVVGTVKSNHGMLTLVLSNAGLRWCETLQLVRFL